MKDKDFQNLLEGVRQMKAIRAGEMKPGRVFRFTAPPAEAIRAKLHLSQPQFAAMLGVSVATVRNWEQGRRLPRGPARALLLIAAKRPQAVL